ncbi:MAG: sigma-54-dependent Fis family transcriptional regulator [Acidobacteriota bacterium]|nr:MAG: sigma-54-dependent Fis family transcriptional regulator [Acidobacteriota bacterium]
MASISHSILIIDDEPAQRQFLRAVLQKTYSVSSAASGEEAKELLSSRTFDLVVTDQRMPGISGIELIPWLKQRSPETPIIVLTAYGTIDSAVEAMKVGADDYLTKPVKNPDELRLVVAKLLEKRLLENRKDLYRDEIDAAFPKGIIAESSQMQRVLELARQVAIQPTTVLLTGESGTGKEVVARFIHRQSPRPEGAFVAVNCAALTETLLESELFGHEKGAFTGAYQAKRGRFELAHGGTLFLDEIGEISPSVQSKLLRVLQEQRFERVGGTRTISVDVRIIAATNRDLRKAIEERIFREDLFYRLSVFPIQIPPLRERRPDILPLANFFVDRIARRMGVQVKTLGKRAEDTLLRYEWPGNIRELQNAIERAMIVCPPGADQLEDLPLHGEPEAMRALEAGQLTLAEMEKSAILDVLERNSGDRKSTAKELGISLRKLQYRLKEYGITGRASDAD